MFSIIPKSLHFLSVKEKWKFFSLLSVRAFSGVLDVLGIALVGLIAGLAASSFQSGKSTTFLGFVIPNINETFIFWLAAVVLVLFVSKALIAVLLIKAITKFLASIESSKSIEIVQYLFGGNLQRINSYSKGHILWAVTGSVNIAFAAVLMALTSIVSEGVLLVLIATTFALVDPVATIFVFLYFGLVIFGLQLVIHKSLRRAGKEVSEGSVETNTAIDDLIAVFRETKVLGKTSFFESKFYTARQKLANANATMIFLSGMPRYVVETALILGVVIFVGFQFFSGQLAQGFVIVGVFLTGGVRIMGSLLPLQNAVANLRSQSEQAKAALDFLYEIANESEEKESSKTLLSLSENQMLRPVGINLNEVFFTHEGSAKAALQNVSLEINPGSHVAVIGPSGAGKTTLVDLILGLIQPTAGTIEFIDENKHVIPFHDLSGTVSYVPQKPGMVSGSIAQNIALGVPPDQIDELSVVEALRASNLLDFVSSLPDGIHSSIGAQNNSLSGGQIQRLGLARALYVKPKLIVLDEATSALDASSEAAITASLQQFGSDVTLIVIAHRLSTVQHSDCVFVLENGQLTAHGKFNVLKKSVPMVAEYVRLMSFDE